MAAIAMETEGKKRFKFYQNLLCRYFLNLMEIILATMALVYAKNHHHIDNWYSCCYGNRKKGEGI